MSQNTSSISVIGGGAWGTALAQAMARDGRNVTLWAREKDVVESINRQRENTTFLPGIPLAKSIHATEDLAAAFGADIILLVTPAQYLRATLETAAPMLPKGKRPALVICSKGIDIASGDFLTDIAQSVLPHCPLAVLTGPTFAPEVARGLPCAVTLASADPATITQVQAAMHTPNFRPYGSTDMIGAQIGGALKNVIAIAGGIAHGMDLGESARAAMLSRGMSEMAQLAVAMSGRAETLLGMCGLGDLVLTASSMQSRNFSLGAALGKGQKLEDILAERNAVTEGVYTARAAHAMAQKYNVDMPVTEMVYRCLHDNLTVDSAIAALLNRPVGSEF